MSKLIFTTPAVLKSQARKRANKQKRRVALLKEAKRLGISVLQLLSRKALEVGEICKNHDNIAALSSLYSARGYGR